MLTDKNLLRKMREQVLKLYSAEVQLAFEKEQDESKKKAFLNQRQYYDNYLHELEKHNLESLLARMKPLEIELSRAITSLDNALKRVNNTVNIISNIQMISSIIARIITIV
ncbi:hypothetical protein [Chlorogloeopsis sp. ULAP02]|uniref:hypothetical protein n=1 Tax=Chlorogloeopsis sp. ULAP02 TaxID=3107926 RepID=UPI0031350471